MKTNRRIIHVLIAICILFLSLLVYLSFFELFMKDKIITSSYNRRNLQREDNVLRGKIVDRTGIVLAESKAQSEGQERKYPYAELYSQVIGYSSRIYGKSLLEAAYDKFLLNINQLSSVFDFRHKLAGVKREGNNLELTIDHKLQVFANTLLEGRKGAVVAMEPQTGKILAMVSKPDFNPNSGALSKNWNKLVESPDSPFLPRATQGTYVPGSTFKVITAAQALEKGMGSKIFDDTGSVTIHGKKFSNYGHEVHGKLDMMHALSVSSNVYFSQLGVMLGENNLREITRRMYFGKQIPFDLPLSKSTLDYDSMGKTDLAAIGIGQGKILVSPLHMAMIASGIANQGRMMKPILVNRVISAKGTAVKSQNPELLSEMLSLKTANALKTMMSEVVVSGTGRNARINGISAAGKTGTAENEQTVKGKNKEHAWFIGFAPVQNPRIAVAVILEYNGSTGGTAAAPIAGKLMAEWLRNKK